MTNPNQQQQSQSQQHSKQGKINDPEEVEMMVSASSATTTTTRTNTKTSSHPAAQNLNENVNEEEEVVREVESESTHYDLIESDNEENNNNDDEEQPTSPKSTKTQLYIKICIGLFLLGLITFVIVDSAGPTKYIRTGIENFLEWMQDNPFIGFFAFMLLNFCTTLLFIPGILLAVGSGYVFSNALGLGLGIVIGTTASFTAAFAGSVVSFLIGRFLLRDLVSGFTKKMKILQALDNAFEEKGYRIMTLLRLSPLMYASPYLNYGSGGLAIKFWDFTLSMFAILPSSVMFVFLGASAESLAEGGNEDSSVTTIILVLGIVLSIVAVAFTSYYAKIELDKVAATAAAEEADMEAAAHTNNDILAANTETQEETNDRRDKNDYTKDKEGNNTEEQSMSYHDDDIEKDYNINII